MMDAEIEDTSLLRRNDTHTNTSTTPLWIAALLITQAAFLSGWHTSILNTAFGDGKGSISDSVSFTTLEQELATAITVAGATITCLNSKIVVWLKGSRRTLLLNNILSIVGTILCVFNSVPVILIGRFLVGLSVGVTNMAAPPLLAEIAPTALRGTLTSTFQLMVTIGILVGSLLGLALIGYVEHGWRYLLLMGIVPSVIQVGGMSYVPDSPRSLIRAGKDKEAAEVLKSLRPDGYDIDEEIRLMVAEREGEESVSSVSWGEVFKYKRPIIIGVGLQLIASWTGINSVAFYSTTVFEYAGVPNPITATNAVFVMNVLMTVLSLRLIETAGRRALLLWGTLTMTVSLIAVAIVLLVSSSTFASVLVVLSIITYVSGFAVGLGVVPFSIQSEVVPTRVRVKAQGLFMATNMGANFILSLTVLSTIQFLGGGSTDDDKKRGVSYLYFLFTLACIVALIFIRVMVPETKGVPLEEIHRTLGITSESPKLGVALSYTDHPPSTASIGSGLSRADETYATDRLDHLDAAEAGESD